MVEFLAMTREHVEDHGRHAWGAVAGRAALTCTGRLGAPRRRRGARGSLSRTGTRTMFWAGTAGAGIWLLRMFVGYLAGRPCFPHAPYGHGM
jgi:hypothetical protein